MIYKDAIAKYAQILVDAGRQYNVSPELLAAIFEQESHGHTQHVVGPETKYGHALGPMQFLPGTARGLGVKNPNNMRDAVFGAAKYLNQFHYQQGLSWPQSIEHYFGWPPNDPQGQANSRAYAQAVIGRAVKLHELPPQEDPQAQADLLHQWIFAPAKAQAHSEAQAASALSPEESSLLHSWITAPAETEKAQKTLGAPALPLPPAEVHPPQKDGILKSLGLGVAQAGVDTLATPANALAGLVGERGPLTALEQRVAHAYANTNGWGSVGRVGGDIAGAGALGLGAEALAAPALGALAAPFADGSAVSRLLTGAKTALQGARSAHQLADVAGLGLRGAVQGATSGALQQGGKPISGEGALVGGLGGLVGNPIMGKVVEPIVTGGLNTVKNVARLAYDSPERARAWAEDHLLGKLQQLGISRHELAARRADAGSGATLADAHPQLAKEAIAFAKRAGGHEMAIRHMQDRMDRTPHDVVPSIVKSAFGHSKDARQVMDEAEAAAQLKAGPLHGVMKASRVELPSNHKLRLLLTNQTLGMPERVTKAEGSALREAVATQEDNLRKPADHQLLVEKNIGVDRKGNPVTAMVPPDTEGTYVKGGKMTVSGRTLLHVKKGMEDDINRLLVQKGMGQTTTDATAKGADTLDGLIAAKDRLAGMMRLPSVLPEAAPYFDTTSNVAHLRDAAAEGAKAAGSSVRVPDVQKTMATLQTPEAQNMFATSFVQKALDNATAGKDALRAGDQGVGKVLNSQDFQAKLAAVTGQPQPAADVVQGLRNFQNQTNLANTVLKQLPPAADDSTNPVTHGAMAMASHGFLPGLVRMGQGLARAATYKTPQESGQLSDLLLNPNTNLDVALDAAEARQAQASKVLPLAKGVAPVAVTGGIVAANQLTPAQLQAQKDAQDAAFAALHPSNTLPQPSAIINVSGAQPLPLPIAR